jgi:hypothetical protein
MSSNALRNAGTRPAPRPQGIVAPTPQQRDLVIVSEVLDRLEQIRTGSRKPSRPVFKAPTGWKEKTATKMPEDGPNNTDRAQIVKGNLWRQTSMMGGGFQYQNLGPYNLNF